MQYCVEHQLSHVLCWQSLYATSVLYWLYKLKCPTIWTNRVLVSKITKTNYKTGVRLIRVPDSLEARLCGQLWCSIVRKTKTWCRHEILCRIFSSLSYGFFLVNAASKCSLCESALEWRMKTMHIFWLKMTPEIIFMWYFHSVMKPKYYNKLDVLLLHRTGLHASLYGSWCIEICVN